jgi:hypothetical protein
MLAHHELEQLAAVGDLLVGLQRAMVVQPDEWPRQPASFPRQQVEADGPILISSQDQLLDSS